MRAMFRMDKLLLLILLAAVFAPAFLSSSRISSITFGKPVGNTVLSNETAEGAWFRTGFIFDPSPTPTVHASCLTELPDGRLLAAWFGGTREGAGDVLIYQSTFDPRDQSWSEPGPLIGPKETQRDLGRYIRKVGNPVLFTDSRAKVWLFYVTVSLGGWSTSHISFITSEDAGRSWSPSRRLVTSPFLNISTMVKGAPFEWSDGAIGVPVYHECLGKFGELLRLSSEGRVLDKIRLTSGRHSIQPVIVPSDERNAIAFLRNCGHPSRAILTQFSLDAGQHWSPLQPLSLPNPNSAIAAVRLPDGSMVLAYNHTTSQRRNLSLASSRDEGRSWQRFYTLEDSTEESTEATKGSFSYPCIIRADDGTIHVAYTWNRTRIKHAMFNEEWVRAHSR
jgi:predicted neuraminidase